MSDDDFIQAAKAPTSISMPQHAVSMLSVGIRRERDVPDGKVMALCAWKIALTDDLGRKAVAATERITRDFRLTG